MAAMRMHYSLISVAVIHYVAVCLAGEVTYYAYDGKGNNLIHTDWGSVGELFLRKQMPAVSGYGSTGNMSNAFAKSPREISVGLTLPGHRNRRRNPQHKTDMLTFIGQFFNHDIDLREQGSDDPSNSIDVEIDHCDLRFNKAKCSDSNAQSTSFSMKRSRGVVADGVLQQVNTITAYLDGSVVYGSDAVTADKLRSKFNGKMLMFNGELPKNTIGVHMENPAKREADTELRAAGDVRANVNPILLAIQSLFVREHNRLADEIAVKNPFWSDEQIFQEARKWNVAFMQSICFYEYIPLLGIQLQTYSGYKSTVNPGIDNFFATVSYRYGHSEVNDVIARVDDFGNNIDDDYITLMDAFFYPTYSLSAGIEPLLRGASFYRQMEVSPHFASSLQNYLFGTPSFGGADLLAINIQRGRDHGMPSYNEARSALGLVTASDFSDITSDVYLQKQLKDVYETVDNIEPYVGGCAEDSYKESNFGELFYTSLADQYTRIRDGDRFYFENTQNGLFTEEEVNEIRGTGLRDIILRNTNIQRLPQNIYISNPEQPWPLLTLQATSTPGEASSGESTTSETGIKTTLRSGVYDVEWSQESIGGEAYLNFKLTCQTTGWIGLGIANTETSAMVGADIIVAEFSNGVASVKDYWAETFAKPVLDTSLGGTDDVELISGSEVDGVTSVEFRRKVETGDSYDRAIRTSGATPVIFAWHSTEDTLQYHTALRRGKTTIEFFAEPPATQVESPETGASVPTEGSITVDSSSGLSFTWRVEKANQEDWIRAKMLMDVDGPSWFGLLLESPTGGLNKADLMKVSTDGTGSCSIRDYWAETPTEVLLDSAFGGIDNSLFSFCYVSGGRLDFELRRPIQAQDTFDKEIKKDAFTDVAIVWDATTKGIDTETMKMKHFKINFFSSDWEMREDTPVARPSPTSPPVTTAPPTTGTTTTTSPLEVTAPVSTTGEVTLDSPTDFVLKYELFKHDIKFDMSFKGAGFAAIGIPGPAMNMVDADVFIAKEDGSGGCSIGDYWSTTFAAPLLDSENGATDDLTDVECIVEGDHIKANLRRKLKTGDSKDREIEVEKIPIIYAFSTSSGGLQYHGPTGRGSAEITPDLSVFSEESTSSPVTTRTTETPIAQQTVVVGAATNSSKDIGVDHPRRSLLLAHVWLLGIGIGVFGVAGMCLERLGRGWKLWKKAHFTLQVFSLIFVFFAEILALAHSKGDVVFAHCILAYILLISAPLQGALCTVTYKKDRFVPAWKKLNRTLVYFICSIGFFQFWLALRLLGADLRGFQLFYAYALSSLITLILTPRSSDRTKELPTLATVNETTEAQTDKSSMFSKTITEKIQAKNAPQSSSYPQAAPRASLIRAASRTSELKIAAFKPEPSTSKSDELFTITPSEFQDKISEGKNWTVISNKVYDMEKMLKTHPGGPENIEDILGKDGTDLYMEVHADSNSAHKMLAKHLIGTLNVDN